MVSITIRSPELKEFFKKACNGKSKYYGKEFSTISDRMGMLIRKKCLYMESRSLLNYDEGRDNPRPNIIPLLMDQDTFEFPSGEFNASIEECQKYEKALADFQV